MFGKKTYILFEKFYFEVSKIEFGGNINLIRGKCEILLSF